jgi:hypothetical protein
MNIMLSAAKHPYLKFVAWVGIPRFARNDIFGGKMTPRY